MTRFITTKYKDGSTTSWQWSEVYDGKWPYPENCEEVTYKLNIDNPLYERNQAEEQQ